MIEKSTSVEFVVAARILRQVRCSEDRMSE